VTSPPPRRKLPLTAGSTVLSAISTSPLVASNLASSTIGGVSRPGAAATPLVLAALLPLSSACGSVRLDARRPLLRLGVVLEQPPTPTPAAAAAAADAAAAAAASHGLLECFAHRRVARLHRLQRPTHARHAPPEPLPARHAAPRQPPVQPRIAGPTANVVHSCKTACKPRHRCCRPPPRLAVPMRDVTAAKSAGSLATPSHARSRGRNICA